MLMERQTDRGTERQTETDRDSDRGEKVVGGVVIRISSVALPWFCSSDSTANVAVKVLIPQCSHFKVTAAPNSLNCKHYVLILFG